MNMTLNPHQAYLIEEFADEYQEQHMSRRGMLRRVLLITGSIPITASTLFSLGCGTASPADKAASATAAAATATATATVAATPGVSPTDPAITVTEVTFPGPATPIKAYMARPSGTGAYPGILIIHENRGLNDHTKNIARRYAKEGFVGLAIDLVSRNGGTVAEIALNTGAIGRSNPDDLVTDLIAALAYLKAQPSTQGKALGVTGFCFGGGYTFEVVANSKDVKAGVPTTAAPLARWRSLPPRRPPSS